MSAIISPNGLHILPPDDERPNLRRHIREDMLAAPPSPRPPSPPPLRSFADLPEQPQLWLWPGRIPCGALTLLCGDEGRAKSLITLDVAARVSAGLPWPCGGAPSAPADVLIFSAEDSIPRTVRNRLAAAGANLQRVHYLDATRPSSARPPNDSPPTRSIYSSYGVIPSAMHDPFTRELRHLKAALDALPECRLVVIDPFTAYLDQTDRYVDDPERIRTYLSPLTTLADRANVAVIAVIHRDQLQRPASGRKRNGLRTLAGMARVAYLVDRSPEDCRTHVMFPLKNNLGDPAAAATFKLAGDPSGAALIEWSPQPLPLLGDESIGAASLPSPSRHVTETDRAIAWLQGVLSGGPLPSQELLARAEAAGISQRCLERARARLRVTAVNEGGVGSRWMCRLPATLPNHFRDRQVNNVAVSAVSAASQFPDIPPTIPTPATLPPAP